MIQATIAIAGVIALVLQIVMWIGSYKRKREKRMRDILKKMKEVNYALAKATSNNDTVAISRLMYELCELRKEYYFLNRQK